MRDPAWVAKGVDLGRCYQAVAWFQPSKAGSKSIGRIALSRVDLNLVAHECCHAAWHLTNGADEERACLLTGELTAKVWARLQEEQA